MEQAKGFREFIIEFLSRKRANPVWVSISECGDLIFELIVFTAKAHEEDAGTVWMRSKSRNQLPCLTEVATDLCAAIGVRKRIDAIDMAAVCLRQQSIAFAGNAFGNLINAPNGTQNPDFLTDTDTAIRADIAHKCWCRPDGIRCWRWAAECIGFIRPQSCPGIMRVDPLTLGNICRGDSERLAIFDNRRARLDRMKRDFVTAHHARKRCDVLIQPTKVCTGSDCWRQQYGNIVRSINL